MRQIFGQDAVFGRRVGGSAEAHHGIGDERVDAKEHHGAAGDLDRVADEHDAPFGHGVGKGTNKSGQYDVGDGKTGFEQR